MSDWISIIILGVLEGITEFIPVSSTGHLLIAEHFLHSRQSDLFNVVIQCGAVIAVLPLFPERLKQFLFKWKEPATWDYLLKILVAFGLTGAVGIVWDKKGFKLPEQLLPVAIAMLAGGILFILIESWMSGKELRNEISWLVVIAVAAGQLIAATFPGSSRSGVTILFALMLGVSRPLATEFSFLVGIPTMLAAGGLKIFKAVHAEGNAMPENWSMLALATIVSAVVSFVAVKWLLTYIQRHTFTGFGWYRVVAGVVLLMFLFGGSTG